MVKNILLISILLIFLLVDGLRGEEITRQETITESDTNVTTQSKPSSLSKEVNSKSSKQPKPRKKKDTAFDLGAPPKARIKLTPELSIGARLEMEYQLEKDFDLDTRKRDDLEILDNSISLTFLYTPTKRITAFANIESSWQNIDDERHRKDSGVRSKFLQGYVLYKLWDGFKISIGRQRIKDKREWVYDERLDAIRLTYRFKNFSFDLSASEKKDNGLYDSLDRDERINNFVLYGRYSPIKNIRIAAYGFVRDGRSIKRKENPIFYGLQSTGEVLDGLNYWLSFGHVRGRSSSDKLRGFGFDSGFTYEFDLPLKPSIVLGYAFGSGDDNPSDNVDRSYRQTGLQDNNAKFNGFTRVKYYGELLDPELSNLAITTAGFGIKPFRKTSIELIHHYYRQHKRSDELRDAEIDEDPDGLNKILGQEIDLVAAYKYKSKKTSIKTSLVLGYFMPGQAFPREADNALFTEFKIQFDF